MTEATEQNNGRRWPIFRGFVWALVFVFAVWPLSMLLAAQAPVLRTWIIYSVCFLGWIGAGLMYWAVERRLGRTRDQICLSIWLPFGLTLLWLLLVQATAVNTINRQGQLRAMDDMRSISAGLEQYKASFGNYPKMGTDSESAEMWMNGLMFRDPWGSAYRYIFLGEERGYLLVCLGKDRTADHEDATKLPEGPTLGFGADIVVHSNRFVRWPEWFQR